MRLRSKVYRIRNEAGAYSTGGFEPQFVGVLHAKTWTSFGALKCHLAQYQRNGMFCSSKPRALPADWTVVEIEITETELRAMQAREVTR